LTIDNRPIWWENSRPAIGFSRYRPDVLEIAHAAVVDLAFDQVEADGAKVAGRGIQGQVVEVSPSGIEYRQGFVSGGQEDILLVQKQVTAGLQHFEAPCQ
jgi:hypothetical protein